MDLGANGQKYLVTGASRGLGYATAACLVAEGAEVIVVARDQQRITAAAQELTEIGPGHAVGVVGDLSDPALVPRLGELGPFDGVVISVGGPPAGRTAQITDDQWRSAFEQIHLGPLRLATALLEGADSPIAVTFVLSSSVRSPVEGLATSNGLRPGLAMAAKTLADEYGDHGHRVNVLLPGRIDTDRLRELDAVGGDPDRARAASQARIPLGRYGTPEEFGAAAAFLTAPISSYISGTALSVDGGLARTL